MHKAIRKHKAYMQAQLSKELSVQERGDLYTYHVNKVRDFQHERAIHLAVTLFFALLTVSAFGVLVKGAIEAVFLPLLVLTILLAALELAYIRHYYLLENGVQSLYCFTDQLGRPKEPDQ